MTCSIEGCEKNVMARGWCSQHYSRWRRQGDANAAPKKRGGRTRGETVHGTSNAYSSHGCRCEECKAWAYEYRYEWNRKNRRARADIRRKSLYGVDGEQYDRMLAAQNGGCAICGQERPDSRNLMVDHCHATDAVRGLLCARCNTGLGMFADDSDRLLATAAYLLQHSNVLGSLDA